MNPFEIKTVEPGYVYDLGTVEGELLRIKFATSNGINSKFGNDGIGQFQLFRILIDRLEFLSIKHDNAELSDLAYRLQKVQEDLVNSKSL